MSGNNGDRRFVERELEGDVGMPEGIPGDVFAAVNLDLA